MIKIIKKYFTWLQHDNPTGGVSFYPQVDQHGETTLKGVYLAGDLTGIPLLKLSTRGASQLVNYLASQLKLADKSIKILSDKKNTVFDLVIIGAGPAGISAAMAAKKLGFDYIVLEATNHNFNTIKNFPQGKMMFYEPESMTDQSQLTMKGETKEKLIEHLDKITNNHNLNIVYQQKVETIKDVDGYNLIITRDKQYLTRKTILASGKTGNPRRLNITGEDQDTVLYQLNNPADYHNKKIFIAGGGDSALEAARLLFQSGNQVVLVCRDMEFITPKEGNIKIITQMSRDKKITLMMESNIVAIEKNEVLIKSKDKTEKHKFDYLFILLGQELPYKFLNSCGIKIMNVKTKITWWWLTFSLAFFNVVYFGKLSTSLGVKPSFLEMFKTIFYGNWFVVGPQLIAWFSVLVLFFSGVVCFRDLFKNWQDYFYHKWDYVKYSYFILAISLVLVSFFGAKYFSFQLGGKDPYFWYSFIYTLTIGLFGWRRIMVHKTKYIIWQTITLFLIQAIPLFLFPNFLLPWLNNHNLIHPWLVENVFMGGEWWRFVGFVLAWPLFIWNIFTEEPAIFWLVVSLIQTFILIPLLVIRFGKGAYCGWICSCGAMAETLGDEYRSLMPHGKKAKKYDNFGQIVLLVIIIMTILHILGWIPSLSESLAGLNKLLLGGYQLLVDTLIAGTIGIGVYFFFSGRVWCRFACPLAALMHIYNKFQVYGIVAEKKRCINCNLCTQTCHMGIDVMNYANKGKPVNDVACVNCSACIKKCPTKVLSFAKYRNFRDKK